MCPYIINIVIGKISIKIIPRIIAVSNAFFVVCVLILSIHFLGKFSKKLYRESSQFPMLFFTFHTYRIPQFAMSVSLFLKFMSLYYQYIYCTFKADMTPFLMSIYTYSLIAISRQIRASAFVINIF